MLGSALLGCLIFVTIKRNSNKSLTASETAYEKQDFDRARQPLVEAIL